MKDDYASKDFINKDKPVFSFELPCFLAGCLLVSVVYLDLFLTGGIV